MKEEFYQLKEWHKDARRGVDHVTESFKDAATYLNNFVQGLDIVGDLITENEKQQRELDDKDDEIAALQKQLQEEKDARQTAEVRLSEMSKLSAGVAKKSSQEGLEKAFRIYINTSKRKTQAKREVAKFQLLDFITTAKLEMPEDIMEQLNHLDDEVVVEPAPINTTVTVQPGGINVQQANTVKK